MAVRSRWIAGVMVGWLAAVLLVMQTTAPARRAAADTPLDRLAAATKRSAADLELLDESAVMLADGRRVTQLKALDRSTGEIVGAAFEGARVVDLAAARAAAGAQWRSQYGAMTPQLLSALNGLRPDEALDIAVWLKADIEPLPRPAAPSATETFETAGSIGATTTADQSIFDQARAQLKIPAPTVPIDQAPPEVRAQVGVDGATGDAVAVTKPRESKPAAGAPDRSAELATVEAFKARNEAVVRAQVAPVQARFRALMAERGLKVTYTSDLVPSAVVAGVTRAQLDELARLPEIDAIYAVPKQAGPSLSVAGPTQNLPLIQWAGYNGNGVKVSVTEGEKGYALNPYLTWTAFFSPTKPAQPHPTGVGGIIKSTASGFSGLANGVQLYGANGSYSSAEWNIMAAAMDWGSSNATVLNNSWYWDNSNNPYFWEADRRQDYLARYHYDFVAVAAGNFGNGCGSNFSTYVVSPAKGYNVLSVGNFDDHDTLGWSDDTMDVCSSFGNPDADTAGHIHDKPEVAAVGAGISSTVMSASTLITQAIGGIGSGTSYASPMAAALAADMIQAQPALATEPERIKSIMMATALHNIEGDARLSDKDGVGAIDLTAALISVERGHSDDRPIDSATTFPITYTQYAYKGERVRFVINWQSNPTADYTSDPLPVDLDLIALRADGVTVMGTSTSAANSFEIVDFIAPASETYIFRISKFGTYTGSNSWLGVGWWRGVYRILPDVGYADPKATPLGTHLAVYPTDWFPTNYWRAFGIRSVASDHDLELYSRSWVDDPGARTYLNGSYALSGTVDFIAVDGNHWPAGNQEQYLVYNFQGDGGYRINWSNQGQLLAGPGLYGPFAMGSSEVVKVFDVYFRAHQELDISLIPAGGSQNDLGMELFRSVAATPATWTRARFTGVASADASTAPAAIEHLIYRSPATINDYLGLVVYGKQNLSAQFYVLVRVRAFAPAVFK